MPLQFSVDDLGTKSGLELVLRQFQRQIEALPTKATIPSLDELANALAPLLKEQLQAQGSSPLNLALLPSGGSGGGIGSGGVIVDSHSNRLTLYPATTAGALYYETDRRVWYLTVNTSGSLAWRYAGGIYYASLAAKPTDLGSNDADFIFNTTDYSHTLKWTGSGWTWGPSENGSGYYQMFESSPSGFGASAWQVCDGSTTARMNPDGTTTSVTVPNLSAPAYLKGGTAAAAVAAASGVTSDEAVHTHPVTITNNINVTLGGGANNAAAGQTVTSGAGSAHHHDAGTMELRNKQVALYYRR